ncbi:MAG TPA: ribonucleotide-diphosphate reductase subunit beta, partial [Rhizobacter sp.]|nr:ribonucleotide-diphosphate reductase subunit beta [Rhizobacter sp.]
MLVWEEDLKPSISHKASPAQSMTSQARAVAPSPVFEDSAPELSEAVESTAGTHRVRASDKRIINGK